MPELMVLTLVNINTMPGLGLGLSNALLGTNVNQNPVIPTGALQFEDTTEYIFFEGETEYITFENN